MEDKITNYTLHMSYFNTWRGGPPARRTNRPTWWVPVARRPSPPLQIQGGPMNMSHFMYAL